MSDNHQTVQLTPAQHKARRQRSIAIGICLGLFVIVFYVITVVKIGPQIMDRAL